MKTKVRSMKIIEYKIVNYDDTDRLEKEVNKEIGNGFEPLGAPFPSSGYLYQALIRHEST